MADAGVSADPRQPGQPRSFEFAATVNRIESKGDPYFGKPSHLCEFSAGRLPIPDPEDPDILNGRRALTAAVTFFGDDLPPLRYGSRVRVVVEVVE